eukprot:5910201-Pleurochrysis_carterae.AAC.1
MAPRSTEITLPMKGSKCDGTKPASETAYAEWAEWAEGDISDSASPWPIPSDRMVRLKADPPLVPSSIFVMKVERRVSPAEKEATDSN